ncbi:MAG: hypothetical protein R2867_21285 [Caldilineaceae bacterium]
MKEHHERRSKDQQGNSGDAGNQVRLKQMGLLVGLKIGGQFKSDADACGVSNSISNPTSQATT